MPTVVWKLFAK